MFELTRLAPGSTLPLVLAQAPISGECTCGAKKGNKIVGGEEASVGVI